MVGLVTELLQNKQQLLVAACLNLGPLQYGFTLGWSASIIIKLGDPELTPIKHEVSSTWISFVATALYIGQILGPMLVLNLSNTKGRKPAMLVSAVFTGIAYIFLAAASHIATVIVGRIICGVGNSIAYILSTVYLGEIASTNIRGTLMTAGGLFLTFGCLLVYTVGPFVPYYAVSILGCVIAVVQILTLCFLVPESPLFLAMKGRDQEATSTLEKLNRQGDVQEILANAKEEVKVQISNFKELFVVKCNRKAFFICLPLGILQQLSGVIVVIFFATTIFGVAESSIKPHIATIFVGLTQFVSAAICPIFVEEGGRRVLMMISTGICSVSLAVLGTFFYMREISHPMVDSIRWLPLATLIVFFIGLETGFGILPITLIGEMFSLNVRSIGSILCYMISVVFGLVLSTVFPYMLNDMGAHFTFWIFSFVCAFTFFYTFIFLPETRGKSLFEIQEILNR